MKDVMQMLLFVLCILYIKIFVLKYTFLNLCTEITGKYSFFVILIIHIFTFFILSLSVIELELFCTFKIIFPYDPLFYFALCLSLFLSGLEFLFYLY